MIVSNGPRGSRTMQDVYTKLYPALKGRTMSIARTHENYAHTWWTPQPWLDWVTATLGEGWHDPCPTDWVPGRPDGLTSLWKHSTYVNHPGSRGSAAKWWERSAHHANHGGRLIWCAFNIEQLRHMRPNPLFMSGWLVMPRERTSFVWGGPTEGKRVHGEPMKSPGNWAIWWTNVEPRKPPVACDVLQTSPLAEWTCE